MLWRETLRSLSKAEVYIESKKVGRLEKIATDEYVFTYYGDYLATKSAIPVSLTLPLRPEPYIAETLHPFFDNLIFEGYQLRLMEKKFGLSRMSAVDRFYLLLVTGEFSFSPVKVIPDPSLPEDFGKTESFPLEKIPLSSPYEGYCPICLEESDDAHPACKKHLWGTQGQIYIEAYREEPVNIFKTFVSGQSISGAQRKALFHLGKRTLTREGLPTHMLKPDGDFAEMPANEHLTMAAAKKAGFSVPEVGLYKASGIGLIYVIKGFNSRKSCPPGSITEDYNQLSEGLSEEKDKSTMEQVAEITNRYGSSSKLENIELFKRMLFCFLTGNGDMHLKNWSLTRNRENGLVKLSPVYDFLSVRTFYPQEKVESILSMGGETSGFSRTEFSLFGREVLGITDSIVEKSLDNVLEWRNLVEGFVHRSLLSNSHRDRYLKILEDRAGRLRD